MADHPPGLRSHCWQNHSHCRQKNAIHIPPTAIMKSIDLFEVLVRENAVMLSAFIKSTTPTNARDDIWQDTMLTAWQRWDDYDRTRPFGAWLRGIAIKNIQTWHRKNKREQPCFDQTTLNYMSDEFGRIHHLHRDTFAFKKTAQQSSTGRWLSSQVEVKL